MRVSRPSSRDSAWSHIAWAQALDLGAVALLSDWNGKRFELYGIGHDYRGMQDVAERSAFLVDRRPSSAGHGGTRRASCPTSTSCSRPPLALVTLLYAAAAFVTWPAVGSFTPIIANDGGGGGEPPAGDHLQSVYRFWLVGHQLEQGEAPGGIPTASSRSSSRRPCSAGGPSACLLAVERRIRPRRRMEHPSVRGHRRRRPPDVRLAAGPHPLPGPAALGGLAFALAPYRLEQSAGHLLGWAALFLPLALLAIERARVTPGRRVHAWSALAAAATISIPLSGQLHLALGAVPFIVAYAAVRFGLLSFVWTLGGAAVAVGIGLAVRYTLIAGSAEEAGRSFGGATALLGGAGRFPQSLARTAERGVRLPRLAAVRAGRCRTHRPRQDAKKPRRPPGACPDRAAPLRPGRHAAGYEALWRNLPPLHFTRVPERLLPLANLALAALAAFACAAIAARVGRRAAPVLAALAVFLALDLAVLPFSAAAADPDNGAYEALRRPHLAASSSCRSSARGSTTRASTTTSGFRSRASIPPATRRSPPRRRRRSTSTTTPLVRRLASRRCSRPRGARDRSVALSPRPLRPGPPSRRLVCGRGLEKPGRRRRTAQ